MLSGKRVLVIEDEPLIAADLEAVIIDSGGIVAGRATSLPDAIMLAANADLDGAILDLRLGSQTTMELLRDLQQRGVACVVHTGQSDRQLIESSPGLRVCDKPCLPEFVITALAAEIDRRCRQPLGNGGCSGGGTSGPG